MVVVGFGIARCSAVLGVLAGLVRVWDLSPSQIVRPWLCAVCMGICVCYDGEAERSWIGCPGERRIVRDGCQISTGDLLECGFLFLATGRLRRLYVRGAIVLVLTMKQIRVPETG